MADLTKKPLSGLLSMVDAINSKILDLEILDGDQSEKLQKLSDKLEPIEAEVKRREDIKSGGGESKHDPSLAGKMEDRQLLMEMRSQVESVPIFGPGSELTLFLANTDNIYSIFVKSNTKFEVNFMRMVKGRLAQAFLTRVSNQDPAIGTYDELKKYLEEHHGSQKTCFQQLDELYDIEPGEKKMRAYAIRLENAGNDLHIKLVDKFKKANKTFDARAMLDLVVAQIYVRNLKHAAPVACYNSIVNSLSSCWDVNSVATHAQSYLERVVIEDELASPNAFFGKKMKPAQSDRANDNDEKKSRKGICFRWERTGKCNWNKCKYDHPGREEARQKELDELPGNYVLQPIPGFPKFDE